MLIRLLLAAIVAGLLSGVLMTGAQELKVTPLILHAEQYEGGEDTHHGNVTPLPGLSRLAQFVSPVTAAHAHGDAEAAGGILFGLNRFGGTLMANLVTGAGFGLILLAVSLLTGTGITLKNGVLWGAAGWLSFQFLPAIGLPPELPGFPAADLVERQTWWIATVVLSALGLYCLVLREAAWAKALGVLLLAAPHLYGAPQPTDIESNVPALLGAEFAVAALATTAFFWVVLGLLLGGAMDRFGRAAQ
ncbi:CbtA family protein [Nitratireductor sp. XY-223]|uniref:CbtA family protein n=1 Tax=Nitratireductor sp. XY-223 TaxID=2561926 RepID=UPI0010AA56DD|nr:CbtA family protein [Nitratireductor sp. XY-223]